MKKHLCAAAATAALLAFAAPASAEVKMTIGGDYQFTAGFVDQDKDQGLRSTEFGNRFRLTFSADAKADNGLEYGARLRIRALGQIGGTTNGVDYDRAYGYVNSQFGRVEFGTLAGLGDAAVFGPFEYGQCQTSGGFDCRGNDGVQDYITGKNSNLTGGLPNADVVTSLSRNPNGNFATRVNYYTPRFAGFQVGLGYAPRLDDAATSVNRVESTGIQDVYDIGLGYDNSFGDVRLRASATYTGGSNPSNSVAYYNVQQYQLGARVDYKGFSVGGGYTNNGKTGLAKATGTGYFQARDGETWNVGAQYATGDYKAAGTWIVGAGYIQAKDSGSTVVKGDRKLDIAQVGVNYVVAPGLTQSFQVNHFEGKTDTGAVTKDKGNVVLLRTNVSF